MQLVSKIIRIAVLSIIGTACVLGAYVAYADYKPPSQEERIQAIYTKLWAQTGVITDYVPLSIDNSKEVNAYANLTGITIYQGMIDASKSDDEIALVLGHEIAHVLSHDVEAQVSTNEWQAKYQVSEMEARADKLGAVYMMKAGFDVCRGRQLWLRFAKEGDYIFASHPGYVYRYSQLNVNCSPDL